jgi:hypothetical protein
MNEDRRRILDMLAAGQVTAAEAERLLAALENPSAAAGAAADSGAKPKPKFLRIFVEGEGKRGTPLNVNLRVPMQLLRAGVKLSSILPSQARGPIAEALREKANVSRARIDLTSLKPENLEELIESLDDLTVNVDSHNTKVRFTYE